MPLGRNLLLYRSDTHLIVFETAGIRISLKEGKNDSHKEDPVHIF